MTVSACSSARAHQRVLERGQRRIGLVDGVADIQPEIGCDLIVARTGGVQPPRGRPDQFAEPAFDIHVNVFQRALEVERIPCRFLTKSCLDPWRYFSHRSQ